MLNLGFVSAILPDLELEEVMKFAAETGYQSVEVMCWPPGKAERRYAGVTHIDIRGLDQAGISRINEIRESTGVEISALGYYPNPLSPDPRESEVAIEHIKAMIHAAPRLSLKNVNSFIGRDWTSGLEENWPRFLEVWKPIIQLAEDRGVYIGIENCPMLFTIDEWPGGKNLMTTPEIWERAFNDIPSDHFGLNFDPSHFIWQQMDYLAAVRKYSMKFFHVHAKDAILHRDRLDNIGILAYPNDYHTPKIPGWGQVDWKKFFGALKKCNYDGAISVEVEDRSFEDSLAGRKEALKKSFTYLKPLFS